MEPSADMRLDADQMSADADTVIPVSLRPRTSKDRLAGMSRSWATA
jgi:hypothetical protein